MSASGRLGSTSRERTGLAGILSKYSEAMELVWFQYVVAYDKQEQRSLVSSIRQQLVDLRRSSTTKFANLREAVPLLIKRVLLGIGGIALLLMTIFFTGRVRRYGWQRALKVWEKSSDADATSVDFYRRLLKALEKRGIKRELYQTPLEFASAAGVSEAKMITIAYNRLRFGDEKLPESERMQIESLLTRIERRNN